MAIIPQEEILFNIVLVNPVIPNNTGNIGRLSVATNCRLHLVHPLGFSLDEKSVRRAGIDWWEQVDLIEYQNWEEFISKNPNANIFLFSRFAEEHNFFDAKYQQNDFLIFGSETDGLPHSIKEDNKDRVYKIPMPGKGRSLNLANSVSIAIYEAMRQVKFPR